MHLAGTALAAAYSGEAYHSRRLRRVELDDQNIVRRAALEHLRLGAGAR